MLRVENRLWSLLLMAVFAAGPVSSSPAVAQDEDGSPARGTVRATAEGGDAGAGQAAEIADGQATASEQPQSTPAETEAEDFEARVNQAFGRLNGELASVMFYKVGGQVPLAVLWLVGRTHSLAVHLDTARLNQLL